MERKSIGVLINILGSLSINLGNNLQSSGHRAHKKNTEHEIVSEKEIKIVEESNEGGYYVKEETDFIWALLDCSGGQSGRALIKKLPHIEPLPHKVKSSKTCNNWLIGTCFFLLGTIAVFVSYSFAPQSLIAPLGSVQFVSNIFFARWIHGAKITRRMLVATSVILVGISLVVHFSPDPNPDFAILNGDNIKELYYYYNYQVYMYVLGCIAISSHIIYILYIRSKYPFEFLVKPICYALLSAIIGTQSTLQAKCLSELLIPTGPKEDGNPLKDWFTYLSFSEFLLTTAFWLYRLNRALALFEPLFIIPVLQVFWTCFATLNGGIFFREFFGEVFLSHKIYGFVGGMTVIFLGVYLLAPNQDIPHTKSKQIELMQKMKSSSSAAPPTSVLSSMFSSSNSVTYAKLSQTDQDGEIGGNSSTSSDTTTSLDASALSSVSSNIIKINDDVKISGAEISNDISDLEHGDGNRPRSRSMSELIEDAKMLIFGEDEESDEALESFTPTLNGLLGNDSDASTDDDDR